MILLIDKSISSRTEVVNRLPASLGLAFLVSPAVQLSKHIWALHLYTIL